MPGGRGFADPQRLGKPSGGAGAVVRLFEPEADQVVELVVESGSGEITLVASVSGQRASGLALYQGGGIETAHIASDGFVEGVMQVEGPACIAAFRSGPGETGE